MRYSIIIPVYNCEKFISRCINSLLEQDFTDYEIICIDDGSTDSTGRIVDEFAKKDQRIKVIHQNNSGIANARNCGLLNAIGEYIYFVDADDWVEQGLLKKVNDVFNNMKIDICLFDTYRNFDGVDIPKKSFMGEEGVIANKDKIETFALYYKNAVVWNKIIRRQMILDAKIEFIDVYYLDDFLFCMEIYESAKNIYYLKTKGYHYVDCLNSITHQHNPRIVKMWKDYYSLALEICPISNQEEFLIFLNSNIFDGLIQTYDRFISHRYAQLSLVKKRYLFLKLTKEWPYKVALKKYDKRFLSGTSRIMLLFGKPSFIMLHVALGAKKFINKLQTVYIYYKSKKYEKNTYI